MTDTAHWPSQAYLDALRPEPGYELKGAIITSYSAEVAAIVAAVLALSGRHQDDGSGRKTDLAEAVEGLRGKVKILIQRGGLARPKRIPAIAGILDQFIRQIDFDEREQSWHPKIVLAQFVNREGESNWRFWLGSRNLTASTNYDFGLLLTSASDPKAKNAAHIPGVSELAERLAEYAELSVFRPAKLRAIVKDILWTQPSNVVIERITLTSGKGNDVGPRPDNDIDEVIAISPFLDGAIVKTIGAWGGPRTKRRILSTQLDWPKSHANSPSRSTASRKIYSCWIRRYRMRSALRPRLRQNSLQRKTTKTSRSLWDFTPKYLRYEKEKTAVMDW